MNENQGWNTPEARIFWSYLSNNQFELERWQTRAKCADSIIEFAERLQNHFIGEFQKVKISNVDYLSAAIFSQLLQDAFEAVDFMEIAKFMFAELGLEETEN